MSYIVKNCPATYKKLRINKNNAVYIDEYRCNYQTLNPCQDCTDCVMKQIVELCKEELNGQYSDTWNLAQKISKLLDIKEVE